MTLTINIGILIPFLLGILFWMLVSFITILVFDNANKDLEDGVFIFGGIWTILAVFVINFIIKPIYTWYISRNYRFYSLYWPKEGKDEFFWNYAIHKNVIDQFNFVNVNDPYVRFHKNITKNNIPTQSNVINKKNIDKKNVDNWLKREYRNNPDEPINDGVTKNT